MIKVIKHAKENYLAHYKVACPRCEAIMEFDEKESFFDKVKKLFGK